MASAMLVQKTCAEGTENGPMQEKTFYHNIATGEDTREKHADETKIRDATSIEQAQYEAREQAARAVVQHGDGSPRQWL